MEMEEAQSTLAAVGTDTAPTAQQLTTARAAFVDAAKAAKQQGDRTALATMLEALKVADAAIGEAQAAEAEASKELDELAADFPELTDAPEETAELADETPRVLSVSEAVARLGLTRDNTPAEIVERPTVQTLMINGTEAADATWPDLGNAFAQSMRANRRTGRTTIATFNTDYDHSVKGLTRGGATRVLDDLTRRASEDAVVAAGGCCTLAEPIRDQPMLSSIARPIADSLPTVGTSAGAVTFFPPVCLPQNFANAWTCEQDAAVDLADESTWKQCVEIECADPEVITVEAIYQCLTIGNFQEKFNPERWDAFLAAAAAEQARLAEQLLFNDIATSEHTTTHTVTDTGSVYATFLRTVLTAAATIRQNQRYVGQRIKVIAPEWLGDAINMDVLARAIKRGRTVEEQSVATLLASRQIDVTWSPDIDPIEPAGQVDGALTEFPDTASLLLFVDGGVFRLDGGEINLGTEIRDHDLNRQNKVAAFAESFEAAVVRSCDSKVITLPVTVCDMVPCFDES